MKALLSSWKNFTCIVPSYRCPFRQLFEYRAWCLLVNSWYSHCVIPARSLTLLLKAGINLMGRKREMVPRQYLERRYSMNGSDSAHVNRREPALKLKEPIKTSIVFESSCYR